MDAGSPSDRGGEGRATGLTLDGFVDEICNRTHQVRWIFGLALLFLVLNLPYLVFAEPGTGLYVVTVMNVVGFSLFVAASGLTIRYCRNRRERRRRN